MPVTSDWALLQPHLQPSQFISDSRATDPLAPRLALRLMCQALSLIRREWPKRRSSQLGVGGGGVGGGGGAVGGGASNACQCTCTMVIRVQESRLLSRLRCDMSESLARKSEWLRALVCPMQTRVQGLSIFSRVSYPSSPMGNSEEKRRLMTSWSATDQPWPEHPRPQLRRATWRTLNGRWRCRITPMATADPKEMLEVRETDQEILVPGLALAQAGA